MKKILFTLLGAVLIGSAANSQFNNDDYGIYLRGTNYHMQSKNANTAAGTGIEISSSNGFGIFTLVNEGNNVYKIKMGDNLFLSLKYQTEVSAGSINQSDGSASGFKVVQDLEYSTPTKPVTQTTTPRPDLQRWKITKGPGEANTYFIRSVAFPDKELVAGNNTNAATVKISTVSTGNKHRRWVIKQEQID